MPRTHRKGLDVDAQADGDDSSTVKNRPLFLKVQVNNLIRRSCSSVMVNNIINACLTSKHKSLLKSAPFKPLSSTADLQQSLKVVM